MTGVIRLNFRFYIEYRFILITIFSLALILFLSTNIFGQESTGSGIKNENEMLKANSSKSNTSEKVKESEEVEISVKAPQAYYIMSRSNFNYENVGIAESFIPKIIKSVEEKPF